ncbi:hypothetical protein ONZ43_g399 [Nemania bipapillata]|uniref:Uncharacterized protein n=1 Tax=Nemania bipapillata TaxID=110536 RepID=A0ACC2J8P4_9PEZI|nr:hypothetical protein ONZ43_g399 [Nemania bipapillata]
MPGPIKLDSLQTERRNPRTTEIDRVPTFQLCQILNQEDREVPLAVSRCIPAIAKVIDLLSERVRNGGRVFYIGAGTSGRLGVLDASEIPPTYSAPFGQFIALIAGGDYALRQAKEGAEDDREGAKTDLQTFNLDPSKDSLIGIASSGRTPYVLGGLFYGRSLGVTTVALVCVSPSVVEIEGNADHVISVVTGPEAVTGSTRMKAGTATKLILNMISTGIMMIDVKATNVKLKHRARNILRLVGGHSCTQSDAELDQILETCRWNVKLAAVTLVLKVSVVDAEERLLRNKGVLAHVFEEAHKMEGEQHGLDEGLVLCIDAGGTSCKAVLMSIDGEMGLGMAGPCNITNVSVDAAVSTISKAIQEAAKNCKTTEGREMQNIKLSAAWIGMAGYACRTDLESAVVVVAGTGSIAMSYAKVNGQFQQSHRIGGWGCLLGDDGSGYSIGREAIRTALYSSDIYSIQAGRESAATTQMLPPLSQAIFEHFKKLHPQSEPETLLSTILVPNPALHQTEDATLATTKRIASVAKLVLSMAVSDKEAKRIVVAGISSLVNIVTPLIQAGGIDPAKSGLVLAGGMMLDGLYKTMLTGAIEEKCGKFRHTELVVQPAVIGAQYMLNQML